MRISKYALTSIWVTLTPLNKRGRTNEFRFQWAEKRPLLARRRAVRYMHRVHLLCGAQTSVPPFSVRQFGQRRRPLSNAFGGEQLMAALDWGVAQSGSLSTARRDVEFYFLK